MDKAIERALFAFLEERSAQCGERFDQDMFEQLKQENSEVYDEELAQMKCALEAAGFFEMREEIAALKADIESYVEASSGYIAEIERLRALLAEIRISFRHENIYLEDGLEDGTARHYRRFVLLNKIDKAMGAQENE